MTKFFNSLKTKKNDITVLQETHSTKTAETKWQLELNGMALWNSGPTNHSADIAIPFSRNFKGKIQNIVNDNAGRIITITFTLNKQNFHITIHCMVRTNLIGKTSFNHLSTTLLVPKTLQ